MSNAEKCRRYRIKARDRAFDAIGWTCIWCDMTPVEAAHVSPTELTGSNARGSTHRYLDVIKHPECYRPMCSAHHRLFDKLKALDTPKEEPIPF